MVVGKAFDPVLNNVVVNKIPAIGTLQIWVHIWDTKFHLSNICGREDLVWLSESVKFFFEEKLTFDVVTLNMTKSWFFAFLG